MENLETEHMDEVMRDSIMANQSPKRMRDEEEVPSSLNVKSPVQIKRLRKAKTHVPIEKDRTRGRYACLGHRMKHKRCPLDCPERRPKPEQEQEIISPKSKEMKRISRNAVAKKHVLQLAECTIEPLGPRDSKESPQDPLPTERDSSNWDSVEWENLSWDNEHCLRDSEEGWLDLKSSSHWEESKSNINLFSEDAKPTDDLTKFEEEEIVDSWLNDDGFSSNTSEFETAEGNATETGGERRASVHYNNLQEVMRTLPKILLTRDMLERFLSEPYFNRFVQGCFVRVKVGEYKDTPVYRIAHIDEVQDNCFFSYEVAQGHTTKGLVLQIAPGSKKVFPIVAISNASPTELDFRTFQDEMQKNNICLDPREVQQKEEYVRVLRIKYPTVCHAGESSPAHYLDPMVNEEPLWN